MSNEQVPSLDTLPIELIYKIFHYLDSTTIVRSLRCVCKRLYDSVNQYEEYDFNFQSISKSNFSLLCNYIKLKHVKSLTLSDDNQTPGQIEYFLSLYRLKYFTQLYSLILIDVDDSYLKVILKDIQSSKLSFLKIQSERDYSQGITNGDDFIEVLSLPKLQKLILKLTSFDLPRISWPIQSSLQYLKINCSNLNDFYHIVHHLPNLRKLVVERLFEDINNGIHFKPDDLQCFHQLESLKLKYCSIDITVLFIILSLTPTIEHLQLIRSISLDDFVANLSEFEKFIQEKLTILNKFDFFLSYRRYYDDTPVDIQTYFTPFQTPFWISTKKWFVICEYIQSTQSVLLYTPSITDSQLDYYYHSKQITRLISSSLSINDNSILMDGVRKLYLNLDSVMSSVTSLQDGLATNIKFRHVNELILTIDNQWPSGSLRYISNLIDLSKIEKLTLTIGDSFPVSSESVLNIKKLFQLIKKNHSLKLSLASRFNISINDFYFTSICPIIPNHVKHLTIQISKTNQMRTVIEQMKYCSSIRFEYTYYSDQSSQIHMDWLARENNNHSYRMEQTSLSLWLNNHTKTF